MVGKAAYRLVYSMQTVQQSLRFHPSILRHSGTLGWQADEAYSKLSQTEKIENKKSL
jgi:hypothetical protein